MPTHSQPIDNNFEDQSPHSDSDSDETSSSGCSKRSSGTQTGDSDIDPEILRETILETNRLYRKCYVMAQDAIESMIRSMNSPAKPPPTEECRVLRASIDHIAARHDPLFNGITMKLCEEVLRGVEVDLPALQASFIAIADEVFADHRKNWGRIVSLFAFGALLAKALHDRNAVPKLYYTDNLSECIARYVTEKLGFWIRQNGGLADFVLKFDDQNERWQSNLFKGLLLSGIGLGLLASLFSLR